MLRKILKMFKESNILKAHLALVVFGVVAAIIWKKNIVHTGIIPAVLLCCTIVGNFILDKRYEKQKGETKKLEVYGHEKYVMLEAEIAKKYPEYLHLHKMMKEKLEEKGANYVVCLPPTWLVDFKSWLEVLADRYENFEMTDIQVAAAIMNTLATHIESDERIMLIFDCVKDLIKAPKKYECKFERDKVILNDTGIIMATSDPDKYVEHMGEEKFIETIRRAAYNFEDEGAEMTVCGIFYDIYYSTKSF